MQIAHDRTGNGPALVLLHPLGADRHVWDPRRPRARRRWLGRAGHIPMWDAPAPLAQTMLEGSAEPLTEPA